jgi:hypothetical protein
LACATQLVSGAGIALLGRCARVPDQDGAAARATGLVLSARGVVEVGANLKFAAVLDARVGVYASHYEYLVGGSVGVVGIGEASPDCYQHPLFAGLVALRLRSLAPRFTPLFLWILQWSWSRYKTAKTS